MARQIQLRRGTTTQTNAFTGALAEVTVDTDKDTVVVHDGSTAGGHPLVKTSDLGTAATTAASDYATAAQGALADTAVQPDDSPSFGSVTVSGTVDGRDVATDGTKLDGIEASADVTDTANVTSAGALMDSEVTNLAQVKAFDSSDYATAAQGTTADAALPRSGGAMTGPITTNSTFDGVDIATRDAVLTSTTTTANAALPKAGGAMTGAITTNSTFDGRSVATDGAKLDNITVTQAVDLDQMEIDIAALANGMVYKGDWDASSGSFPGSGSAQTGWFYYVSVAGTVGGVSFSVGDNIVAIADNASTSTYASNWSKHDQTDAVTAVVGLNGSITKSGLLSALNVEDGADVTDATNVTAAGALMDSEVTNLAQVKAFDSTDYATAAQGSTADAALPKSGGAMTGAITTNSTFDGRDVATDGAKLDGIEAGATADQTNAEIRAAVEAATDSNVFTDADHTKLNGIAAGATNVTNNNQLTNGAGYTTYTANQSLNTSNSPSFAGVNINGNLNAVDHIYLAGTLYHEGDTNTYLSFDPDTITLATAGSSEITVNGTGVRLGDTGNGYFQPVSGDYGSIQIDGGAHTGWEGYNIGGHSVFMSNGSTTGVYNDANNQWILEGAHNGTTHLHYAGTSKLDTLSNGVSINGNLYTDGSNAEDYDALSGTSPTCDVDSAGAFSLTMSGNTTFTFSGADSGWSMGFVLQVTGNGSTLTWPSTVDWAGGTAPDAPASGESNLYVFYTRDGGSNWIGALSVAAYA